MSTDITHSRANNTAIFVISRIITHLACSYNPGPNNVYHDDRPSAHDSLGRAEKNDCGRVGDASVGAVVHWTGYVDAGFPGG